MDRKRGKPGWRVNITPNNDVNDVILLDSASGTRPGRSNSDAFREPLKGGSGAYRWFLVRGVPQRNAQGTILHWVGTCTDIDEQKRVEEALLQSQERIRALIDSNIIGIVSVEAEGEVIVEANDAWLHMTGYSQEDVRSRTLSRRKITPPEQAPLFERALQEVTARGQHIPFETEVICRDGSHLPVVVGGATFQQHPLQLITFVLDNSARKALEQRKDDFISIASHELMDAPHSSKDTNPIGAQTPRKASPA